jgi:hypothetical protein
MKIESAAQVSGLVWMLFVIGYGFWSSYRLYKDNESGSLMKKIFIPTYLFIVLIGFFVFGWQLSLMLK